MPQVTLICGKICSGKTTYARSLMKEDKAVLLSCDELMLALFGHYCGENHDEIQEKTIQYLFRKSVEMVAAGVNVILDFGFWSKAKREQAKAFYSQHGIVPELHYMDISPDAWRRNIESRNMAVDNGDTVDYYVDDNIIRKVIGLFEAPKSDEIDVWVRC